MYFSTSQVWLWVFHKIKTPNIERIRCATVVTLKIKTYAEGKSLSGDMQVAVMEINLHNITMCQIAASIFI